MNFGPKFKGFWGSNKLQIGEIVLFLKSVYLINPPIVFVLQRTVYSLQNRMTLKPLGPPAGRLHPDERRAGEMQSSQPPFQQPL